MYYNFLSKQGGELNAFWAMWNLPLEIEYLL